MVKTISYKYIKLRNSMFKQFKINIRESNYLISIVCTSTIKKIPFKIINKIIDIVSVTISSCILSSIKNEHQFKNMILDSVRKNIDYMIAKYQLLDVVVIYV